MIRNGILTIEKILGTDAASNLHFIYDIYNIAVVICGCIKSPIVVFFPSFRISNKGNI